MMAKMALFFRKVFVVSLWVATFLTLPIFPLLAVAILVKELLTSISRILEALPAECAFP